MQINSIRTKIVAVLLSVVFAMALLVVVVVLANNSFVSQFQQINNNIVYEQQLQDTIQQSVLDFYNDYKMNDYSKFDKDIDKISELENILDQKVPNSSKEVQAAYKGVKNSQGKVLQIIQSIRTGKSNSADIESITAAFNEATEKFEFVKQNTVDLILAETKHLSTVTQQIQKTHDLSVIVISIAGSLIVIITLVISIIFANNIAKPITELTKTAKSIADGNLSINLEKSLISRDDEIGILSNSFNYMVDNLKNKIHQLEISEQNISKKNEEISQNIDTLNRMNKLMIGREMAMIEIKRENEELKTKLGLPTTPNVDTSKPVDLPEIPIPTTTQAPLPEEVKPQ